MKKNLLSLAVAAGVAGVTATAQANMYINPENTGEVLLFPFYNAENGNTTTFHIVNTTAAPKAVKVRIMEFVNSQEVLDFNLYLSAEDHFAFGIIGDPNGDGGALVTSDNSCTVPALGTANGAYPGTQETLADGTVVRTQPFVPYQYRGDTGWNTVDRTLMGHVEVIEMGVLFDNDGSTTFDPASWATHNSAGVPASCASLDAAWATGVWGAGAEDTGVTAPTGGLYGISSLLNVADAAAYGIEPAAIEDWSTTVAAEIDDLHSEPGSLFPSMNNGGRLTSTVYHGLGGDNTEELVSTTSADAVSSLFMTALVENDVMINDAIGGQTDWVITFPTRRYYVNGALRAPFTDLYSGTVAAPELSSCEDILVTQWDREEANVTPRNSFSPRPPGAQGDEICWETNVISARSDATAMNTFAASLPFSYAEGWQRITFADGTINATTGAVTGGTAALAGHVLRPTVANGDQRPMLGLPAMGFAAYKYVNGTVVDGALNNYGFVSDHKTDTVMSVPANAL
jgi:hypothetical protein